MAIAERDSGIGAEPQEKTRGNGAVPGGLYRWYVLAVLITVYAFSYIDRQIITILGVHIKADLGISDAQFGLLFGTAFALFYGLFGIPLARLADGWSRVKTLALSLSFWSGMTALSGFANNFAQIGGARIGVGVGEAGATPAAVSLLGDYFERRIRGMVLSFYSVGVYIGAGVSLMIGGGIVAAWTSRFGPAETAPFGLAGWQAAFIAVGLPGILLAIIVWLTIREPVRGALEGKPHAGDPTPFRSALHEMSRMFPPWTLIRLWREGYPRAELYRNLCWLAGAIGIAVIATILSNATLPLERRAVITSIGGHDITANHVQWIVAGIALYCITSWFQFVRLLDPRASILVTAMTFRGVIAAGALLAFSMNAVNGFVFLYANRYLGVGPEFGLTLGVIALVAGSAGITLSGMLSDRAKRLHPAGRLYFVGITTLLFSAAAILQFQTESLTFFILFYTAATFFVPMWFGPLQATTQDLVTPRLRGTAFAVFSLGPNIIGLGLGPYMVGLISDATGDLRLAIMVALSLAPLTLISLFVAASNLRKDEAVALDATD